MPKTVFNIFLSSTFTDLERHRAKVREVIQRLGQASLCMETWGAQSPTILETSRQQILDCDALVVIAGHRCGWIPSVAEGGDGEKSITRFEVEWAAGAGKPVYAFVVDPKAHWHEERESDRLVPAQSEEDEGRRERETANVARAVRSLVNFWAFLAATLTCEYFASEDDLAGKVATTLANWIREQQSKAGVASGDGAGRGSAAAPATSSSWSGSPFPGLRAFTPADAPIFFGRRRETDTLVAKLCDSSCRVLLVAGASASGKSSLVGAGLIPRLKAGAVPGSEKWLLPDVREVGHGHVWIGLRFTPGEQGPSPFQALASKLAPMLPGAALPRDIARELESTPDRIVNLIDRALGGRPSRAEALVFVDQFEELITIVTDIDLQARFVDMLVAASHSSRIRIVATVRNDFWHRCIEAHHRLAELLRERGLTVPLAIPGHAALTEMIDGPAQRAGLRFDGGLIDELVEQTVLRPGGLALLAFALHELYSKRATDGQLSRDVYRGFGGLAGVISARAERTYAALSEAARTELGLVFGRLVLVSDDGVATRQRAVREEIVARSPDACAFVDAFEKARLLVSDAGPDSTSVLEVAHEALLREWPLLADWIRERADDLHLLQQVKAAAREWHRHDRSPLYLWPQERLVPVYESRERLGRNREDLEESQRSFLRHEWEWLVEELEKPATTHQRRAEIGDRLDRLGDPRPGVGLKTDGTPDIVWREIPAGSVELEGVTGRFDVAAFFIAKYPVTYKQYKAFLDDPDGYRNSKYWKDLKQQDEPGEQYRAVGNHPAENVSWHDAVAFCRWLSARLGCEVRLPYEWEWQQAATGGNAHNEYPWGPAWDGVRANTWESRLNRTTAVGMYPRGASAQGVPDLAGTIWEWCLNLRDNPRDMDVKQKGNRVLRGGSWDGDLDLARASYRNFLEPDYRGYLLGFRVVRVSPIS
jgi:hypothetical protein